ncbi:molybdenum cofactor guanylyltransferase MobA [Aquisalimonas sp.]|uniref:molybdenum cofactor guanylyltransferase MobA n=1 Tax=unclassified Aquisalimonas TaxID=2644645 RepID=UPI0025BE87E2|nr:molybdenum cofactor guanylyltransferase MobA [Aquisalimonas sp.]
MTRPETNTVTGVVLAGGRATRMNGTDKGLVEVAGEPMVDHVIRRLRPQVAALVINANRSHAVYATRGWPVVPDAFGEFAGPLAGMAAGLRAAETEWVVTVPCDSPLVPADLVTRLSRAVVDAAADAGVASGAGRMQPVFALLPRRLLPDLESFLSEGGRKIDRWYAQHAVVDVEFDDAEGAFLNVNTPDDRDRLEARLEGRPHPEADH